MLLIVEPPAEVLSLVGGSTIGASLEDNRFENVYVDLMTTFPEMFEITAAKSLSEPVQPKRLPR